jgi:1-acyl-sn-glycerol-3-phosphate acyltransferase
LKTIFHRLRGLFCVLLLPLHTPVLALAAMLVALVSPAGDGVLAVGRLWSRIILATAGVRVRRVGKPSMPPGPCVVVANHQSLFDVLALLPVLPGSSRMVAKRSLFRIPFFGWGLRLGGFIPLDRKNRDQAIASLDRAVRRIHSGITVVIFVEGSRSWDGKLRPLKKGAFHLAQDARVPMVPVTVSGSRAVLPRQGWLPRPGEMDVVVGSPLPAPVPGEPIRDEHLAAVAAALEAGYTDLHRADLEAGRPAS